MNPEHRCRSHEPSLILLLILQVVKQPFLECPLGFRSRRDARGISLKRWSKHGEIEYLTWAVFVPSYKSQLIAAQLYSFGVFHPPWISFTQESRFILLSSQPLSSHSGLWSGSEESRTVGSSQSFMAGSRNSNKDRSYEPTVNREIEWKAVNTPYPSLEISKDLIHSHVIY